jgi:hypothetical protein
MRVIRVIRVIRVSRVIRVITMFVFFLPRDPLRFGVAFSGGAAVLGAPMPGGPGKEGAAPATKEAGGAAPTKD